MTAPVSPFAQTAPTAPPAAPPSGNPFTTPGQPVIGGAPMHTPAQAPVGYPQPATAGADPFAPPALQAERPRILDLYGRLLLVIPKRLERGVASATLKNTDGSPQIQDRMTTDVIVLDGGPLDFGGKPEGAPPIPHTKRVDTPHRFTDMYVSSKGLVSQSREALAKREAGQPGMVLGRLTREAGNNKPWLLAPYNDAEANVARQYLATVNPFE
jgi:hypothetical protein